MKTPVSYGLSEEHSDGRGHVEPISSKIFSADSLVVLSILMLRFVIPVFAIVGSLNTMYRYDGSYGDISFPAYYHNVMVISGFLMNAHL